MNFKKLKPSTVAAFRAGQAKIRNRMKHAGNPNPAQLMASMGSKKGAIAQRALSPNPMARKLARRP